MININLYLEYTPVLYSTKTLHQNLSTITLMLSLLPFIFAYFTKVVAIVLAF